jgi:hypothetical protein
LRSPLLWYRGCAKLGYMVKADRLNKGVKRAVMMRLLHRLLVLLIAFGLSEVSFAASAAAPSVASAFTPDGPLLAKRKRKRRRRRRRRSRKKKVVKPASKPAPAAPKPVPKPVPKPARKLGPVQDTEADEDRENGLAVMDLKLATGIDPSIGVLLNETIITKLDASGRFGSIISGADMRDMVDLETQKQALGCEQDSCLAELGGALGVPYMMVSNLGRFGTQFILNIKLVAVEESKVVARVNKILKDEAAVLAALPEALDEIVDLGLGEEEEDEPVAAVAAAAATQPVAPKTGTSLSPPGATRPMYKRPLLWAGVTLLGAGTGIGFASQANVIERGNTYHGLRDNASTKQFDDAYIAWQGAQEEHGTNAMLATSMMVVGTGLAAYAALFGGG